MYRIEFFDKNEHLICTHSISANGIPPSLLVVDNYCKFIERYYPWACRWKIYDDTGELLLSRRKS